MWPRQRFKALEQNYLKLKAAQDEEETKIYSEREQMVEQGYDHSVVELTCSSKLFDLRQTISKAKNDWELARSEELLTEAKRYLLPLPVEADASVWQTTNNSLLLTEHGCRVVRAALEKEKRERAAIWRSTVAFVLSIIATIVSFITLWHTFQKDARDLDTQAVDKVRPPSQPPPSLKKH